MKEHNKTYYSLEELKRARDCYEGYQDGEEVYYFVGALRYACDEIERLKNILIEIKEIINNKYWFNWEFENDEVIKEVLEKIEGVDKNA